VSESSSQTPPPPPHPFSLVARVLLLLNFEKAFDRIEWGFLFPALSKLGFYPHLHSMDLLFLLAHILINQSKRETRENFRLARSIRQGCPLAPYLFILATDVLGHMLDDPKHEIKGLHLPKGGCV
jgi:hypothetical protein